MNGQSFNNFGFPDIGGGDNTRVKPFQYYESNLAITTSNQTIFNDTVAAFTRNKKLPLSGQEIALIQSFKVYLLTQPDSNTNNIRGWFNAHLKISVNDKVKCYIPLADCLNINLADNYHDGGLPGNNYNVQHNLYNRVRKLKYPIIVNSNSNIKIEIVRDSAALANIAVIIEGVQYDKLTDYNKNFVNGYEALSTTIYDSQQIGATGAKTFEMFKDTTRESLYINKTFPLSNDEIFQIENIELAMNQGGNVSEENWFTNASQYILDISVNDVNFYNGLAVDFFSILREDLSVVLSGTGTWNIRRAFKQSKTLETPIILPSKSNVDVKLYQNSGLVYANAQDYIKLMFRGTLYRKIS